MRHLLTILLLAGMAVPALAAEPADAVRPFYEHIGLEYEDGSLALFADPALSVLEGDRRMAEEGDLCLGFLIAVSIVQLASLIPAMEEMGKPVISGAVAVGTGLVLAIVALAAGLFPARAAARLDPVVCLRG